MTSTEAATVVERIKRDFKVINLGIFFDEPLKRHPDGTAIVDLTEAVPRSYTYAELEAEVCRAAQALAAARAAKRRSLHRFHSERCDLSVGISRRAPPRRRAGADQFPTRRRTRCGVSCATPVAAPSSAVRKTRRSAAISQTRSTLRFVCRPTKPGRDGCDYRALAAKQPDTRIVDPDGVRRYRLPALHLRFYRHAQGHRAHPRRNDLGYRAQPDLLAAFVVRSRDRRRANVSQERDARLGQAVAARRRLARDHAQLRPAPLSAGAVRLQGHQLQRRADHVRRDVAPFRSGRIARLLGAQADLDGLRDRAAGADRPA